MGFNVESAGKLLATSSRTGENLARGVDMLGRCSVPVCETVKFDRDCALELGHGFGLARGGEEARKEGSGLITHLDMEDGGLRFGPEVDLKWTELNGRRVARCEGNVHI